MTNPDERSFHRPGQDGPDGAAGEVGKRPMVIPNTLNTMGRTLRRNFDAWLQRPNDFRTTALAECAVFPEGALYPFAIPALAYANLAFRDVGRRDHCRHQMATLIDILVPLITQEVIPGNDLTRLTSYGAQATRLATLNLVLGNYGLIGGDDRYREIHRRVSEVLWRALEESRGAPINSYPEYSWNFDTIMALVSLTLVDPARAAPLFERHLRWLEEFGTDPATHLPYSEGWRGACPKVPRGCALSMLVCLLAQVGQPYARRLYRDYCRAHWVERGFIAGFAEWPKGTKAGQDVDSGPIMFGIGATATGVGIGATLAMGDGRRLRRLCAQLALVHRLKGWITLRWFRRHVPVPVRRECLSGFLYGDTILFYALTWSRYPEPVAAGAQKN